MKQHYTQGLTFVFMLCLLLPGGFSQTFVKQDAAGSNDGSSWADAYTDLQMALDNTASGEIWVAAATYNPGGSAPTNNSMFAIGNGISLYGGFAGTETSLAQRNPSANATILSGDLNGDDVDGDFSVNKTDNTLHVVYVDSLLATPVVIDGFTIMGGHTLDDPDMEFFGRVGGGIFAFSTVAISGCTFRNNFARSGGAVYLGGLANGSEVSGCTFTRNSTTEQSAGIFAFFVAGLVVKGCSFEDNETQRGALYPSFCNGVEVDSCFFGNNVNASGFGGAFFSWNSTGVSLSNSTFFKNTAANAGAVYFNGSELVPDANNFTIQNCSFIENLATDFGGGAIWNTAASFTVEDCTFRENIASNGGHVFQNAPGNFILFKQTDFLRGNANGWGGAATCYGLDADYTFEECLFEENVAAQLGGAVNNGFAAKTTFEGCTFNENVSQVSAGGAIALQNDSTTVIVRNSIFNNNTAEFSGGAIFSGATESSSILEVDGCEFWVNQSLSGIGGAISIGEDGDDDIGALTLANSLFGYNVASIQAGALNLVDVDATITSCLFFGNVVDAGVGAGGAISINASDGNHAEASILNSTFADNDGELAAGIANWTGATGTSNTTIQNCIFRHQGAVNYAIEDGTPVLISNGGNLSDDGSMSDVLTQPSDIEFEDPDFADPDEFDYSPSLGSVCIDAGVDAGAPLLDMLGNPRVNTVDIGALENQNVTSVKEAILENNGQLTIAPNPVVTTDLKATLVNNWNGELSVRLFNVTGQAVQNIEMTKAGKELIFELPANELEAGMYELVVSNGSQAVVARFVKM